MYMKKKFVAPCQTFEVSLYKAATWIYSSYVGGLCSYVGVTANNYTDMYASI